MKRLTEEHLKNLKIALVGYGAMGQEIEKAALKKGVEVVSTIDPHNAKAGFKAISKEAVQNADVCICFTQPAVALKNIEQLSVLGKKIIIGTTGWDEQLPLAQTLVKQNNNALLYSSNFSLGMNLFFKLIEAASQWVNNLPMYDVFGFELHHSRKLDSPSGTARTLAQVMIDNLDEKTEIVEDRLQRKIKPHELHFASIRGGGCPGQHSIQLDSDFDSILLQHTARSREGFATGALFAAAWLKNKLGFYTEQDWLNALFSPPDNSKDE